MVRRKRRQEDDDDDENYIPANVTREERYAQRVNRVPPPYTYVVKTAERKDGITYRRKVYTFLNREIRIMYKTLWAQENKFEKLKRLSNWNQVNGRYFWLTYYTAMKILHNSLEVFAKLEPIFESMGPFLRELNGIPEGEPIVNDNEYGKKYTRKINRVRDGLTNIINYWRKVRTERLLPVAREKEENGEQDPYEEYFRENQDINATVWHIKKTYKHL